MVASPVRMAGVVALVLGLAHGGLAAVSRRRPLDHRIKHFEPITLTRHHLRRSLDDPRPVVPFTVPLVAFNQTFELELKPATHLFSDQGAYLTTVNAAGEKFRKPIDAHGFYSGRLGGQRSDEDERATFAHVTVHKDGTMQGLFIDKHGEGYHVDPASAHFDDETEFDHVIYKESDVEFKGGSPGGMHAPAAPTHVDKTMYNTETVDPAFEALMEGKTDIDTYETSAKKGQGRRRNRRSDVVSQSPYKTNQGIPSNNVCHVALWADKEFTAEYGGESAAIVKMLQRFSVASQIFEDERGFEVRHIAGSTKTDPRGGTTQPTSLKLAITEIMVESSVTLEPGESAEDYLKTFGTVSPLRNTDWSKVCLAAGFTYRDYSGTLGLAWTAKALEWDTRTKNFRRTTNGGVCTAQYTNTKAEKFSTNTCMVTSLNFQSKQPELQISLVLAHEFGHNFGAPHDITEDTEGYVGDVKGDYLMYPYSVTGIDMNNNIFSRASVESINTVLGDAAGCMLAQSEGCGNFQTDGDEDCDCGGSTTSCAALKDTCCSSGCKFVGGATCSPLDRQHGACCKDDCTIQADVTCIEQSVCQKAAECSVAGKCPDTAVNRPENAICQQEVAICATGRCSGLCDANGGCTKSICELWGKEECDPGFGKDNGCKITCKDKGASDSTCKTPATLGTAIVTGFGATDAEATSSDYAVSLKAPGSKCQFLAGLATSGLCSPDGNCYDANTEEDLMAQMFEAYNWALETFSAYIQGSAFGIPRYVWGILIFIGCTLLCCGMCYVGNHPNWSVRIAHTCGCDHHKHPEMRNGAETDESGYPTGQFEAKGQPLPQARGSYGDQSGQSYPSRGERGGRASYA